MRVRLPSRQAVVGFDVSSLITLLWLVFYFAVFYWFYSIMKRMERTLQEIKKALEARPQAAAQNIRPSGFLRFPCWELLPQGAHTAEPQRDFRRSIYRGHYMYHAYTIRGVPV